MLKWLYSFSEKEYGSGSGLKYPVPKRGGFIWIYAIAPTKEEISKLAKDFGLKTTKFHSYAKENRSVRYAIKPLSFVIVDHYLDNDEIKKEKVLYVIGRKYIIVVTPTLLPPYRMIFERIKEEMLGNPELKVSRIVYEIVEEDTEENYDILERIETKAIELERDIIEKQDVESGLREIIKLKRKLSNMSKAFWSSSKILYGIKKGISPFGFTEDELRLIDDIHDTFIHQIEIASTQKEMLTDTITIYQTTISNRLAQISNKINESIKRLTWIMLLFTGLATILTIPNTIATIFGIPDWPLDKSQWEFVAITLLIGTVIPLVWFYMFWIRITHEHKSVSAY